MTQTIEQLVVELRADVGALRSQLRVAEGTVASSARRMERDLGSINTGFARLGSSVKAIGLGIAGALGVGSLTALASKLAGATRSAIDNAAALQDLSQRAGITAEKYQELRFAIEQAGGDVSGLDNAVLTFARNLSDLDRGTGKLAKFLAVADPGFAATLRGAKDTGAAMDLLADRVAALGSEQDRLALIQAAAGKTGSELVLAFSEGAAGLADYAAQAHDAGAVISNEAVKSADDLKDAVTRVSDVIRAQFTTALLDAQPAAGDLLSTLSDPESIRAIGQLASDVGELARVFLDLAAGAGRAIREIRNLEAFGEDRQLETLARTVAAARFSGEPEGSAIMTRLEGELKRRMEARSASKLAADEKATSAASIAQRGELAGSLGFDEFGNPLRPQAASYSSGLSRPPPKVPKAPKGASARGDTGRDPLAVAVSTIREEMAGVERLANERKAFEESVTRDFEQATLSRVALAELETSRRIAELDRLGFATEKAATLRTEIEAAGAAKLREIQSESANNLAQLAQLGLESVADFLTGNILGKTKASFGELVSSFGETLVRMEIQAAATSIGKLLRDNLAGAGTTGGAATGAASNVGGSVILGLLGKVFGFAEGGLVTGPTLGLIGEDPSTRPELVIPLAKFERLRGDGGGASIEVVNTVPGIQASARKVRRNGREKTVVELESAFGALLQRGAFRDQLGGRHAPGMR